MTCSHTKTSLAIDVCVCVCDCVSVCASGVQFTATQPHSIMDRIVCVAVVMAILVTHRPTYALRCPYFYANHVPTARNTHGKYDTARHSVRTFPCKFERILILSKRKLKSKVDMQLYRDFYNNGALTYSPVHRTPSQQRCVLVMVLN